MTHPTKQQCPYCKRPADSEGGINHTGGCAGLDEIPLNRLQYDALLARTAEFASQKRLDCCPPGTTKEQQVDVLERLQTIHSRMHAGKCYSFEQTLLCDTVREVERLRAELAAMTDSRNAYSDALVTEAKRRG